MQFITLVDAITIVLPIVVGILCLVLGAGAILLYQHLRGKNASKSANKIVKDAEVKGEHIIKNAQIDAKQAAYELRLEAEKEIKEKKSELSQSENKLFQREQAIDRRDMALIEKENNLEAKNEDANRRIKELQKKDDLLQAKIDSIIVELEKVSNMSVNEAREEIFKRVESKISNFFSSISKRYFDSKNIKYLSLSYFLITPSEKENHCFIVLSISARSWDLPVSSILCINSS